jgi:ribonuclease T1
VGTVSNWMRPALVAAVALAAAVGWCTNDRAGRAGSAGPARETTVQAPVSGRLPGEARATLEAIARGGPYAYDRDGTVFQNREGLLPSKPSGYYREYTVATPGSRDRGARRIVTGGDPPEVYYYTEDHYRSFRRIEEP